MDDNGQFLICEVCGCPVAFDSLQLHSDWHDSLMVRIPIQLFNGRVANSDRVKVDDEK